MQENALTLQQSQTWSIKKMTVTCHPQIFVFICCEVKLPETKRIREKPGSIISLYLASPVCSHSMLAVMRTKESVFLADWRAILVLESGPQDHFLTSFACYNLIFIIFIWPQLIAVWIIGQCWVLTWSLLAVVSLALQCLSKWSCTTAIWCINDGESHVPLKIYLVWIWVFQIKVFLKGLVFAF